MAETTINEQAIAGVILDSFPDKEDLDIDHEREYWTLYDLEQAAKKCGDTLFLWIVREIREGANARSPGPGSTADFMYTVDSILRLLERGQNDLNTVIAAFRAL